MEFEKYGLALGSLWGKNVKMVSLTVASIDIGSASWFDIDVVDVFGLDGVFFLFRLDGLYWNDNDVGVSVLWRFGWEEFCLFTWALVFLCWILVLWCSRENGILYDSSGGKVDLMSIAGELTVSLWVLVSMAMLFPFGEETDGDRYAGGVINVEAVGKLLVYGVSCDVIEGWVTSVVRVELS